MGVRDLSKTTGTPSGTSLDVRDPLDDVDVKVRGLLQSLGGPFFMGLGEPLGENQEDVEVRGPF